MIKEREEVPADYVNELFKLGDSIKGQGVNISAVRRRMIFCSRLPRLLPQHPLAGLVTEPTALCSDAVLSALGLRLSSCVRGPCCSRSCLALCVCCTPATRCCTPADCVLCAGRGQGHGSPRGVVRTDLDFCLPPRCPCISDLLPTGRR